jgi:hypothetical protein
MKGRVFMLADLLSSAAVFLDTRSVNKSVGGRRAPFGLPGFLTPNGPFADGFRLREQSAGKEPE